MVKARRIVFDARTGKAKEEEFEFTPPPPPPKRYLIRKTMRLKTGREIPLHARVVEGLSREEIEELRGYKWEVEER